jgi:dolichyl-phosphate beta-glucosyltransferase
VAVNLAVLAGFAAISFAYFGWRLLPHPGRELVGLTDANDADIFVWSLAWWPHAILSWTNPFFSHVVYAPTGINLATVTSVPGLALLFSPVTLLFGPAVSFNVAAVLLPALSAWTAFLLFRSVTRSTGASLVGGYLFGFSSYMLGHQLAGHLNLTAVFLVPLVALVVLRYVRAELDSRGLAWRLGLIVALQIGISTEVSVTVTIALVLGLALAFAFVRDARSRIRSSLLPIACGYVLAAVLTAPFLYYALTGLQRGVNVFAPLFSADLAGLVVPTRVTGWGGESFNSLVAHWPGNDAEHGSYLGLPALLIVLLLVIRRPRTPAVRFLLAAFLLATFLSLGTALYVNGHRIVWLPWSVPSHWTGLEQVIPSRLALYATLAVAAMVAIWISTTRGKIFSRPYVLPALAVAALVPPVWNAADVHHPSRWAFFSDGLYKSCVPRGGTLMVFPFGRWGESLIWQAESGFWFKMPEGTLAHNDQPKSFAADPTVYQLLFQFLDPATRPTMDGLVGLAKRRNVDRIVSVAESDPYPSEADMQSVLPVSRTGDVFVAPACGEPSLSGGTGGPA